MNAEAPIVSIRYGSTKETILAAQKYYEQGLLGTPFVPPSVPENEGIMRLIAKAGFSENTVIEILSRLENLF